MQYIARTHCSELESLEWSR